MLAVPRLCIPYQARLQDPLDMIYLLKQRQTFRPDHKRLRYGGRGTRKSRGSTLKALIPALSAGCSSCLAQRLSDMEVISVQYMIGWWLLVQCRTGRDPSSH